MWESGFVSRCPSGRIRLSSLMLKWRLVLVRKLGDCMTRCVPGILVRDSVAMRFLADSCIRCRTRCCWGLAVTLLVNAIFPVAVVQPVLRASFYASTGQVSGLEEPSSDSFSVPLREPPVPNGNLTDDTSVSLVPAWNETVNSKLKSHAGGGSIAFERSVRHISPRLDRSVLRTRNPHAVPDSGSLSLYVLRIRLQS